jgi:hypothetical protein
MENRFEADVKEVTWGWWLLVLTGVLSVVAGVIILFQPGDSLPTLAVIAGIFLLVGGILELASAFLRGTQNRGRSPCSEFSPRSSVCFWYATRSGGSPPLPC